MNWNQIHTTATPQEREEITILLIQRIHAKNNPVQPIKLNLPIIHSIMTLLILYLYPANIPKIIIPITWAASLSATTFIWVLFRLKYIKTPIINQPTPGP